MKKWTSVLAVLVATVMVAASAYAGGAGPAAGGSSDKSGATGAAEKKSDSPSTSPSLSSAGDFTGRHTMEGEVTRVDQKSGHLTLKTAEGNMSLHFPPSALENVKKGDRVSVELALKPIGSASSGSTAPSASPSGEKSRSGGSSSGSSMPGGASSGGEKKY